MKKTFVAVGFLLLASSGAFAQGEFMCSALCGGIQPIDSDTQGLYWIQMMASGTDAPTAFASLQAKCQVLANKNPSFQPPISLYIGFNANANNQDGMVSVYGNGFPATQDSACIAL